MHSRGLELVAHAHSDLSDVRFPFLGHVVPSVVVCLLLSIMVGRVTKGATVIGASCCGALPA